MWRRDVCRWNANGPIANIRHYYLTPGDALASVPPSTCPPFLEHRDSHADAGPAPLIMFPPRGCGPKCSNRNIQLVVALVLPRVLVMSGPGSIRGSTLMGMIVCVA